MVQLPAAPIFSLRPLFRHILFLYQAKAMQTLSLCHRRGVPHPPTLSPTCVELFSRSNALGGGFQLCGGVGADGKCEAEPGKARLVQIEPT